MIFEETGDRPSEAEALNDLGRSLCAAGRADEALARHAQALAVASAIGTPHELARAHDGLADASRLLGALDRARDEWLRALEIYSDLGVPEAAAVRASLAALTP
jgi:tetratricopeptide (TPR) repeat protein